MAPLSVEVYSDIVCPWCFIGHHRLGRVIASLPGSPEVTITHSPFFLQNDTPAEGVDIPDMLRKKYGADPRQMFASVEAAARSSDLPLDLSRQPRMYPTAAAHTLLRLAAPRGTQHALTLALFQANFVDALNIADPAVLATVAAPHGFTADEVAKICADPAEQQTTRDEARRAAGRGIRGVPFFVFNGRLGVSGAQPEATLRQALLQAS